MHNATNSKRFHYTDYNGTVHAIDPIDNNTYDILLRYWRNYKSFGLPSGTGWSDERQWLLDFLIIIKDIEDKVINRMQQAQMRNK